MIDQVKVTWVEAQPPLSAKGKCPKWTRMAGVLEDGRVFVPAIIAATEQKVWLCASFDGVGMLRDGQHNYYPVDWIIKEFPQVREIAEKIERKAREAAGNGPR